MTSQTTAVSLRPADALQALIAHHGPLRVILALPVALVQQRRDRPIAAYALSPYLQRDIGMPPDRSRYWDLR